MKWLLILWMVALGIVAYLGAPAAIHHEAKAGLGYFLVKHRPSGRIVKVVSGMEDLIQLHPGAEIEVAMDAASDMRRVRLLRFVLLERVSEDRCVYLHDNREVTCDGKHVHSYWIADEI